MIGRFVYHSMELRPTLPAIISELILWGVILLVLFLLIKLPPWWGGERSPFREEKGETITLWFNDVSQLAVGSPVNFMGTDIGYVTKVRPRDGLMEVQVRTYPNSVVIPKGSHFTVEFNGLAGAKTLEILPPPSKREKAERLLHQRLGMYEQPQRRSGNYIVEDPIRIKDVINTQMILAKALEHNARNFAHSLGAVRDERALMERLNLVDQRILEIYRTIVYTKEVLSDKAGDIDEVVADTTSSIDSFMLAVRDIEAITQPAFFKTNTMATIRYFSFATEEIYKLFTDAKKGSYLAKLPGYLEKSNSKLERVEDSLNYRLPQVVTAFSRFNCNLCWIDTMLAKAEKRLFQPYLGEKVEKIRRRLEVWSEKTAKIGKSQSKRPSEK